MATSEVAICNSAIAKIGGERLVALTDQSVRGRLFNEQYSKIRDELLYAHPWKFAIKRNQPAQIVEAPGSLYESRYQLPADCLRVLSVSDYSDVSWTVENGYLITNQSDPVIYYVAKIIDVSKFTPGFSETLSAKLAADLCYSLVQSVTLRQQLIQEYEKQLRVVRSYNAQEMSPPRVVADNWLRSWLGGACDYGGDDPSRLG